MYHYESVVKMLREDNIHKLWVSILESSKEDNVSLYKGWYLCTIFSNWVYTQIANMFMLPYIFRLKDSSKGFMPDNCEMV